MESCPKAKHLNLTRLPKITDKTMKAIANAGLNDLEYLNLYANATIEDPGFLAFGSTKNYSKLKFLDLCGCKNLSDDSVI